MQNMPGMKMGNKGTQKKKTTTRRKPSAKKHNMANMPGMNMPGMKMSGMHKHTRRKKQYEIEYYTAKAVTREWRDGREADYVSGG